MINPCLIFLISSLGFPSVRAGYAPKLCDCPTTPLVRPGGNLSDNEEAYRLARKLQADEALRKWLKKTDPGFGAEELPTIALATSGGGYRSLLSGAGVVQALDSRDSNSSVSGLYQALTYHSGLSGGGWMVFSIAGNNYPTISHLKEKIWKNSFKSNYFAPKNLVFSYHEDKVVTDVLEKQAAGFNTSLVDRFGRLLTRQFLGKSDDSSTTLSSIASMSNFTSHSAPIPIITALGTESVLDKCRVDNNSTTYEFTPFEFGSWDRNINAFTPSEYLGTQINNGNPLNDCVRNYDDLGFLMATSSNILGTICSPDYKPPGRFRSAINRVASYIVRIPKPETNDMLAMYRNPFYNYTSPTADTSLENPISDQEILKLVDSGLTLRNNPISPLLQPARKVDVILVNDNSGDFDGRYPNGTRIETSYIHSFEAGLSRMPFIPSPEIFVSKGLNTRATIFGCGDPGKTTLVYLPNNIYTYDSGVSTFKLNFSPKSTEAMIRNGNQIATQGNQEDWPVCLGCALMMNTKQKLPEACSACLAKYCYNP